MTGTRPSFAGDRAVLFFWRQKDLVPIRVSSDLQPRPSHIFLNNQQRDSSLTDIAIRLAIEHAYYVIDAWLL